MFLRFAQQFQEILLSNEFHLFKQEGENDENKKLTAFLKPSPPVLYLITFADCNDITPMELEKMEGNFVNTVKALQDQFLCTSIIFLRIATFDDYSLVSKSYSSLATGFVPGEKFYSVTWFIDFSLQQLVIPQGESTKVLSIRSYIEEALSYCKQTDNNEPLGESLKIKTKAPLAVKHNFTGLTYSIILANIALFLIISLSPYVEGMNRLVMFGAIYSPNVLDKKEFYRLFSALFIHGSIQHLFSNCFGLLIFGSRVEKYLGRVSFLGVYFFSGIFANFIGLFVHTNAVSFGASGSVFALVGALCAYSLINKRSIGGISFIAYLTIAISLLLPGFLFIDVDNVAHIIGMIGGFLLTIFMVRILGTESNR